MAKKFVICPGCHTNLTLDMEPGEVIHVECPKCHKTGEIVLNSMIKELDFYPLVKPFSYVKIVKNEDTMEKQYRVIEPILSDKEQKTLDSIQNALSKSFQIKTDEFDEDKIISFFPRKIRRIISKMDDFSRGKIFYYVKKDFFGYGKIDPLMHDPNIEDISCDGYDVPVFLSHRRYGSIKSNVQFDNKEELYSYVKILAQKCGKHIGSANPMLDANLPDGSRIQMTLGKEVTTKGSTFSIRKSPSDPYTPIDLLDFKTISAEMLVYFWLVVENGFNALYAGGTASGKTTVLNALSLFIPRQHKVVSIEETREINLVHPNWIPGVARSDSGENTSWELIGSIGMYDLLKAALRQRPEYILMGEICGEEAYVLFQAMATGHATYSTMHADSAEALLLRLEYEPINIPHHMLESLDVVSFHSIVKVKGERVRRCKRIVEITGTDPSTKEILVNEVFHWDPTTDQFIYSGKSHILELICNQKNITHEQMNDEMKRRVQLVTWMDINHIRDYKEVTNLISKYNGNPEETLNYLKNLTVNKKLKHS
jgi:flagellar protein FlaI